MNAERLRASGWVEVTPGNWEKDNWLTQPIPTPSHASPNTAPPSKRIRQSSKPLNGLETKFKAVLEARNPTGVTIREQAITLKLDPPFKSYRADLSYWVFGQLYLVEVKGPHRFRRAGIAKVALAAKTYPEFVFLLADWDGKKWNESFLNQTP